MSATGLDSYLDTSMGSLYSIYISDKYIYFIDIWNNMDNKLDI